MNVCSAFLSHPHAHEEIKSRASARTYLRARFDTTVDNRLQRYIVSSSQLTDTSVARLTSSSVASPKNVPEEYSA